MAGKRRVVITGLGAIAPNGIEKEGFWWGLLEGRSGIRRITHFDPSEFPCQIAGEVADFEPTAYLDSHEARRLARVSQFAVIAAKMALQDSGIQVTAANAKRIGVCFGTS